MKTIFETSEETNDPEKINKALDDIRNNAESFSKNNIGLFESTGEVISSGSVISQNKLLIENNQDNKRIVLNLDGKNYKIDLTEVP